MDKPLSGNNKIKDSAQADTGGNRLAFSKVDLSASSIGAYNPDLSRKAWEESRKAWNSTPQGRLAIRTFSRGVLGAAFFTTGGLLTSKWMHTPGKGFYDYNKSLSEQENPLQFIAKLIDTTVGRPIELTVNVLGGDGERFTRFRETKYRGRPGRDNSVRGRSLGNEVVSITFDFFCASVGDAWGRDIAGWIDPNVKKKWVKDGHIDVPSATKQALKAVTRYITYNGGEDWAVAIPYVYFMKGHRALLNKFSPGFAYDFDRGLAGGSFKVNDKHEIVGNFNKEGALDLQHRFVVYNMGTLLYRELYDYISKKIHGHQAALYGDPGEHQTNKGVLHGVGNVFKWITRGVVKAGIYMTPAVPFFWITRTPQNKRRGLFINPDMDAMLCYQSSRSGMYRTVHANKIATGAMDLNAPVYYSRYVPNPTASPDNQFTPVSGWLPGKVANPLTQEHFDPHALTFGPFDTALNEAGRWNRNAAKSLDGAADWLDRNGGAMGNRFKNALSINSFSRFTRAAVYASASYTPYMYAKAEFANLWDNGKMDVAVERAIDGATGLNWGEFKAGAGEVWRALLHKPFADPKREAIARRREFLDTSAPDAVNRGDADVRAPDWDKPIWQQRVVAAPKPEAKPKAEKSFVEQEEMRKALDELNPPTNSIH